MSMQIDKASDTEQERQQQLEEMLAEHEPHWLDQFKPGSFGCHELLDRTMLAANLVEEYVRSHPACVQNQEWFALAEQAMAALWELYQRIGSEHLDERSPAASG
jgi:hypothetical protein